MAVLKRHRNLSAQIPEDVRERALKAGVKDIDWYAGRVDAGVEDPRFIAVPPGDREELEEAVEQVRREESENSETAAVVSQLRSAVGRLLPRRTRQAR